MRLHAQTKRAVDAVCVADKDPLTWDRDLAGFGVRVHATGRKVYVVRSRGPCGPKRVSLGLHGELSADEARKQAAVVVDRIKRGEEPAPAPPEPELTVAGLAERFMRVQVHCKPRTVTKYRNVLDGHILPALGAKAVSAVERSDIAALHHALRDTPGTANGAVKVVSAMFTRAEAWELVAPGHNVCRSVRPSPDARYGTGRRQYRRPSPRRNRRSGVARACGFQSKPIPHSTPNRSPVPQQTDQ